MNSGHDRPSVCPAYWFPDPPCQPGDKTEVQERYQSQDKPVGAALVSLGTRRSRSPHPHGAASPSLVKGTHVAEGDGGTCVPVQSFQAWWRLRTCAAPACPSWWTVGCCLGLEGHPYLGRVGEESKHTEELKWHMTLLDGGDLCFLFVKQTRMSMNSSLPFFLCLCLCLSYLYSPELWFKCSKGLKVCTPMW